MVGSFNSGVSRTTLASSKASKAVSPNVDPRGRVQFGLFFFDQSCFVLSKHLKSLGSGSSQFRQYQGWLPSQGMGLVLYQSLARLSHNFWANFTSLHLVGRANYRPKVVAELESYGIAAQAAYPLLLGVLVKIILIDSWEFSLHWVSTLPWNAPFKREFLNEFNIYTKS